MGNLELAGTVKMLQGQRTEVQKELRKLDKAIAVLRELSAHKDLLPLAFHVDYWNNLGWVDPFSSAAFTARQQTYASNRGFEVYTPQLVVEGRSDVIGSSRSDVAATIDSARREAKSGVSIERPALATQ